MPEHFHLLIWPGKQADPSRIVQSLKERTAIFLLQNLRQNRQQVATVNSQFELTVGSFQEEPTVRTALTVATR